MDMEWSMCKKFDFKKHKYIYSRTYLIYNCKMSSTYQSITGAMNNMWNMVGHSKHINNALNKLTQDQLIQLSDNIRDIFRNSELLDPPVLCVVGSQSSGKSITLNGLTGIDILPNGKSIVTRTPIHLRFIHTKDSKTIYVDFFDHLDSQKIISSFQVDAIQTPNEQLIPIRDEIQRLTEQRAGRSKDVVDVPIDIKIRSPDVPNLSIIDLPGLTNIALTDEGQPENIKENIEQMLIKYIKNPRTIILSIIPATIDVESDMGLGLIKSYDPEFKRTIGVITKIDMLKDSNVEHYLSGKISRNLRLGYGYYAVRNRSSEEIKTMTVKDGYQMEQKFFNETEPYKSSEYITKTGSINLGNRLSEILLAHLRDCLPTVMEEIKNEDKNISAQLDEIGRDYPVSEETKCGVLNTLISNFNQEYYEAINQRGSIHNTGAKIADSFNKFDQNMEKLNPFAPAVFSDSVINNIICEYNGIHMPDMVISTGVIEKCFHGIMINGRTIEPLKFVIEPTYQCIKEVQHIMTELVDVILRRDKYSRFPNFCSRIKEIMGSQIIPSRCQITYAKVDDFVVEETKCIWTNDHKFRNETLPNMSNKSRNGCVDPQIIRSALFGYFDVVRNIATHSIRKKINAFFVDGVILHISNISDGLLSHVLAKHNLTQILEENKEKVAKREKLIKQKEKIDVAKDMIFPFMKH